MSSSAILPANQKRRINTLRVVMLVMIPLVLFTRPGLPLYGGLMDFIESVGMLLVIGGVLGRFWSILYIGSRKNALVMRDGPYSICRHPLYLFSTISVFGFGLMLGSLVLTMVMTALIFYVLNDIASKEEQFLRSEFGPAYEEYAAVTPRIMPKFSQFSSPATVTFDTGTLRRNFFDALVFLSLLPIGEMTEHFKDIGALPTFPLF
ncbi:methyltransferase family protein [Pacificibacter marinus]|uniref:Isoprenylcysteine carboxyl methyltransferase (ICMT) family protein n=1 Tax=Pacificibacter marinus TaxID=658057 RepID=A0A1Y5TA33_9RHOB|nr:isoprenylcysteine carboxylmethyltransferase family protein [Pacificibacter marinus]SEL20986.1 Protein-S-isoprenylcysteine O-methyltransferase Ste14 [Pacificibacter marinus]SLN55769.1 Isoprenylcysteine carboxyl methyltransferase (ICMT) family protein [Pacificibacter marinus]